MHLGYLVIFSGYLVICISMRSASVLTCRNLVIHPHDELRKEHLSVLQVCCRCAAVVLQVSLTFGKSVLAPSPPRPADDRWQPPAADAPRVGECVLGAAITQSAVPSKNFRMGRSREFARHRIRHVPYIGVPRAVVERRMQRGQLIGGPQARVPLYVPYADFFQYQAGAGRLAGRA